MTLEQLITRHNLSKGFACSVIDDTLSVIFDLNTAIRIYLRLKKDPVFKSNFRFKDIKADSTQATFFIEKL